MTTFDRSPLHGIYNRFLVRAFLVNSLPKAGTNLLAKAVGLFPGIHAAHLHFGHSTLDRFAPADNETGVKIAIGVGRPQPISQRAVRQLLLRLRRGHYGTGHVPFSQEFGDLLLELRVKTLLIVRDPRDVVVSHANYVAGSPTHTLWESYQRLSPSERIQKSIMGVEPTASGGAKLLSITDRCRSILPWMSQPYNHTTYFERLVGPQGGGVREAQTVELECIARHLGIRYARRDIERIAERLYGGTTTFRKGIIGDWRNHFTAEHKRVFKELAGDLLIDLGYEQNDDW